MWLLGSPLKVWGVFLSPRPSSCPEGGHDGWNSRSHLRAWGRTRGEPGGAGSLRTQRSRLSRSHLIAFRLPSLEINTARPGAFGFSVLCNQLTAPANDSTAEVNYVSWHVHLDDKAQQFVFSWQCRRAERFVIWFILPSFPKLEKQFPSSGLDLTVVSNDFSSMLENCGFHIITRPPQLNKSFFFKILFIYF